MSFASPTSWTDVDYGGTAVSWTAMLNKLPYPPHEMARLALVERATAAGVTVDSDLQTVITPNSVLAPGWYRTFEDELNDLVGLNRWVDHSQANGSGAFVNETVIPMWTMASIMTEISDTRIVTPNESGVLFSADWLIQQYKVINLLRWLNHNLQNENSYFVINVDDRDATSNCFDGIGLCEDAADWTDLESDWSAASWVEVYGDGDNPIASGAGFAAWSDNDVDGIYLVWELRRQRVLIKLDFDFDKEATIHTYAKFGDNIPDNYANDDYTGDVDGEFLLVDEYLTPTSNFSELLIATLGDFSDSPVYETLAQHSKGYDVSQNEIEVIAKLDVSNGFDWKDW